MKIKNKKLSDVYDKFFFLDKLALVLIRVRKTGAKFDPQMNQL